MLNYEHTDEPIEPVERKYKVNCFNTLRDET